jgi:serine protease AprX
MLSWPGFLRPASALALVLALGTAMPAVANPRNTHRKLDRTLTERAATAVGTSRVIVTFKPGIDASSDAKRLGAKLGRRLNLTRGQVMELANAQLNKLANHPAVESIRWDRPIHGLPRTEQGKDAGPAKRDDTFGYTGEGVGVAIIDSGVTAWHDDLTYDGPSPRVLTNGGQRVAAFVDYVNGRTDPYDDYGHGTHVAGIIAGNGLASNGLRKGTAPDAHLVVLKVLDSTGRGYISNVLAALEFVAANKNAYNIRVVNMSISAPVLQSIYDRDEDGLLDDPLARSTAAVVDLGVVVVAAAGNLGRSALGTPQYGGVTAPGNAPWVLTVGAYSHEGTANPRDDVIAAFSSRGPTAIDFLAKPDLVAPGTGIMALSDPSSELYARRTAKGAPGAYLALSGTSVAAPAVSGTVALMVQANPGLTPNLAKAVLQYTAQFDADYDPLTQGAGCLNVRGAVELAEYFVTARAGERYPRGRTWTRKIIWGNYRLGGGALSPDANAWDVGTRWGAAVTEDGDNIVWGTRCATEDCDNIVWGTFEDADNIVWGTITEDGANIVWGTAEDADNIVWGTDCGGDDCGFNIVWGTLASEDGDNIVWGTAEDVDNIVWGTSCDAQNNCSLNIVWGTEWDDAGGFNIVWSTAVASPAAAPTRRPTAKNTSRVNHPAVKR